MKEIQEIDEKEQNKIIGEKLDNVVISFNRPFSFFLDDNMDFNTDKKLNLAEIFKRFEVNNEIPFVKYKDIDRRVLYKLDTKSLITRDTNDTLDEFLDISDFKLEKLNLKEVRELAELNGVEPSTVSSLDKKTLIDQIRKQNPKIDEERKEIIVKFY